MDNKMSKWLFCTAILLVGSLQMQAAVYVSSSEGNDRNNGKSPDRPLQSLQTALNKDKEIYLKRGDVFYGSINIKGKKIQAYGSGPRPVISGYKRIVKPNWKKAGRNLWKINLKDNNYSGVIIRGSSELNDVGCIHEYDKDLVHGRKVEKKSDLKKNWDMWQTPVYDAKSLKPAMLDELILYLKGTNPNKLKLEFSIGATGVTMVDSAIDGIEIRGFGRHGIAAQSNTTITNCRIDAIGGMAYLGIGKFACLGNGIEFYINRTDVQNCLVSGNIVTRCYDCGMTIQGSESSKCTASNILIEKNMLAECCQAWEDFLNNGRQYNNCRFSNNVAVNCGNTSGFGYPDTRFMFCNVLGHNHNVRNGMIIEGNTFVGGNLYCASPLYGDYKSNIWRDNIFYTSRGHWLMGYYTGAKDIVTLPTERGRHRSIEAATEAAIKNYREATGDQTTQIIIKSEAEINALIQEYKQKIYNQ